MESYKIAVLLSAYNGQEYIEKQIKSILEQKINGQIKLIIRDDGSQDKTLTIIENKFSDQKNVEIISGQNIGLVQSFFWLLRHAFHEGYKYYAFSDQDDYWLPGKLEAAVKQLDKEDNSSIPILYGCRSFIVDQNLNKTGYITQARKRNISFYNTAIQNIVVGHNQVLNGKLAEILINNSDDMANVYSQDLWITNVAAVSGKIIFDNTPHTLYRMHGKNELGYGKNKIDRIRSHVKRLFNDETKKMAYQLNYFDKKFNSYLTHDERNEMHLFFASQSNLKKRLDYVRKTQLYRQEKKENLLFKILYLIGSYNV